MTHLKSESALEPHGCQKENHPQERSWYKSCTNYRQVCGFASSRSRTPTKQSPLPRVGAKPRQSRADRYKKGPFGYTERPSFKSFRLPTANPQVKSLPARACLRNSRGQSARWLRRYSSESATPSRPGGLAATPASRPSWSLLRSRGGPPATADRPGSQGPR